MTAPVLGPSPSGGGPVVSPPPVRGFLRRPDDPRTYLTGRQVQVLRLAANGNTNRAIGSALGIAEESVKSQMQLIFKKLRVNDRAQAVAVALRLGVLSLEDVIVPKGANRGYHNSE
jgi:DNA-binding NarL/FixJ family response regulator